MPNDESPLEAQALSQVAEIGITNQLDAVEEISVDVKTDLLKMVQGKADSISVVGQGLVVQQDIRVQEMELYASNVAVDLLRALFGEVELHEPADATIRVVLKEADINRALNSDFIRSKMLSIDLDVGGELVSIQAPKMELQLRDSNKMVFMADIVIDQKGETQSVSFTASARLRTDDQPVMLEGFYCTQGQGISLEMAHAFMQKANELANLPYFEFEGTAFQIKNMAVAEGSLTVEVEARVRHIPSL